jgi:post-segregation antitoxin (ccd killing protein)
MPLVREAARNRAVKKTLTIPQWLDELAREKDVNFSLVLQEALKERLRVSSGRKK